MASGTAGSPHPRYLRVAVVLLTLLAAGRPLASQSPAPPGAVTQDDDIGANLRQVVHDTSLANGLQVISVENHSIPLVMLMVVVRTGAFTQETGRYGVPHLFEHMLFKSYNADGRKWGQGMGRIEYAGYNGQTNDEYVNYFVVVPADRTDDGLRALAELVRDPVFHDEDLRDERHVVFDEINRDNSEPEFQLYQEVNQRLWTTAWGQKNPLGDPISLLTIDTKALNTIYKHYYVPNNAAVIISGDVTPSRAFKLADDRFGRWKRQPDPFATFTPVTPPPLRVSAAIIDEHPVKDVLVQIEWQGPSTKVDAAGTYAADVLSSILDAPGSTFQQRLVDGGLFSSCSIGYLTRDHVGPVTLTAHVSLDSMPRALAALATELQRLGTPAAFTDDELESVRQERAVNNALLLERRSDAASEIASYWASAGLPYFMGYADQLRAVGRPQIEAYVRRYLNAPMAVGLLAPEKTGETLKTPLLAFLNARAAASKPSTSAPTQ